MTSVLGELDFNDGKFNTKTKMKTSKILLLTALLAAVCIGATEQQQRRHEVVFIWSDLDGANYYGSDGQPHYTYQGATITSSSSSDGAPTFPQRTYGINQTNLVQVAEAVAQLRNLGYQIKVSENGLFTYCWK